MPFAASPGERPSKTQAKRDAHALQALGRALAALGDERLAALALPESLREALAQWQRTRSHEGRRRQMQYIGRLMRGVDAAPLQEAVAQSQLAPARDALALHRAERWRETLVDGGDVALGRWAGEHPGGDVQHLRSLVRAARAERVAATEAAPGAAPRKGRAWRELYRFLRRHDDDGADDTTGDLHDDD